MIWSRQDCNSYSERSEGSSGGRGYVVGRVSPTSRVALTRLLSESRTGKLEPVIWELRFAGLAAGILRVEEAADANILLHPSVVLSDKQLRSETRYGEKLPNHRYLRLLDAHTSPDWHGS